jgi:hypothetical protein
VLPLRCCRCYCFIVAEGRRRAGFYRFPNDVSSFSDFLLSRYAVMLVTELHNANNLIKSFAGGKANEELRFFFCYFAFPSCFNCRTLWLCVHSARHSSVAVSCIFDEIAGKKYNIIVQEIATNRKCKRQTEREIADSQRRINVCQPNSTLQQIKFNLIFILPNHQTAQKTLDWV